jgi:hypothetical protein
MIWYLDPVATFLDPSLMSDFLPLVGNKGQSLDSRLNALMRLAIYFALVMILLNKHSSALFALLLASLVTYIVWSGAKSSEEGGETFADGRHGESCRKPTLANPFMNPMPFDPPASPEFGACDIEDPIINEKIHDLFDDNLYREVSDVYQHVSSERQYYTVPVTTIPNDQVAFARWLYDTGPTCKDDQRRCSVRMNETLRSLD